MKRYIVLIATCLISLCIGCGLAWSVNQVGLVNESATLFGKEVSETAIAFTFTLYCGIVPIPMIAVGIFQRRFSTRQLLAVSGFIFCSGIFLAGFAKSLPMIYITYGIMGGFGSSAIYNTILGNLILWFPDRKGFATGMMAATYGSSSLICAPVMQALIKHGGVMFNLRIMGIVFAVVIFAAGIFLYETERDYDNENKSKGRWNILTDIRFPFALLIFTGFAISGLMIINQVGSMAIAIGDVSNVALIVMAISLMNILGRICFGIASDRIGRPSTIICTSLLMLVSGITLLLAGQSIVAFVVSVMLALFAYGGCVGCIPALLADFFGPENSSFNYGILCIGYAAGGYIGPIISAQQFANTGAYTTSFIIICAAASMALVASLLLRRINVIKQTNN